jgi:hypothetical protein
MINKNNIIDNLFHPLVFTNDKLGTITQNYNMDWSLLTCYDPLYKPVKIDIQYADVDTNNGLLQI